MARSSWLLYANTIALRHGPILIIPKVEVCEGNVYIYLKNSRYLLKEVQACGYSFAVNEMILPTLSNEVLESVLQSIKGARLIVEYLNIPSVSSVSPGILEQLLKRLQYPRLLIQEFVSNDLGFWSSRAIPEITLVHCDILSDEELVLFRGRRLNILNSNGIPLTAIKLKIQDWLRSPQEPSCLYFTANDSLTNDIEEWLSTLSNSETHPVCIVPTIWEAVVQVHVSRRLHSFTEIELSLDLKE